MGAHLDSPLGRGLWGLGSQNSSLFHQSDEGDPRPHTPPFLPSLPPRSVSLVSFCPAGDDLSPSGFPERLGSLRQLPAPLCPRFSL